MTRKNRLPEFPIDYVNEKADEYDSSKWMERNQKRSTLLSIQYLFDDKLKDKKELTVQNNDSMLILDLGCGTGFSSEILMEHGFRVIGVDILYDMIAFNVKCNDCGKEEVWRPSLGIIGRPEVAKAILKRVFVDLEMEVSVEVFGSYQEELLRRWADRRKEIEAENE